MGRPDAAPAAGPGTELTRLLAGLGLRAACGPCRERAARMDEWGPAGCRARRPEILGWLREEYRRLGWAEALRAGVRLVLGGVPAGTLTDPVAALLDEAVRRAAAAEARPGPALAPAEKSRPPANEDPGTPRRDPR